MNRIVEVPLAFLVAPPPCLEELSLNSNPLVQLRSQISNLKSLKILGIAHTKITELPSSIERLNLEKIVVQNTPLIVPKLATAERGFKAIKDYFAQQREIRRQA